MAIKIKRTGHLVLKVKDLERSRKFFTEILGLPVVGEAPQAGFFFFIPPVGGNPSLLGVRQGPGGVAPQAVFLSCSPDGEPNHHVLAIRRAPDGARLPQPDDIGMEHVAYELASFADLQEAYQIGRASWRG